MSFLYDYVTWDLIKRFIDPNKIDNFTFDYSNPDFYNQNKIEKNIDGYFIGPNGHYDKNIKDYEKVTYRFNNLFFRSDHFEKLNNNSINILYSGCSWTYGTGMYEEYIWPTVLSNKISQLSSKQVKSFNVALPGSSIFLSIKNIMSFIRNYGKPTYIFINMPPIARDMRYDKKNNFFYSVVMGNGYFESNHPKIYLEYIKNHSHEDSILKAVEHIRLFEDYCNYAGIKLVWTYWHDQDKKVYEDIEFNNIFYPDHSFRQLRINKNEPEYYQNINNLPLWELAQDNHHPGSAWNIHCAEEFFEELVRRGYAKDIKNLEKN